MHPALLKLIEFRMRASGRRMVRGLKTPRGIVFFLAACAMLVLWIGPAMFMGMTHRRVVDPEATRAGVPMLLLLMCVWTIVAASGDKAIYFAPGEVNFLLGGPFRRRELLVYKLLFSVIGAAFSALIFASAFLSYFQRWLAAYVGIFLALGLIQLLSMSCLLIAQAIGERAYSRARKVLLVVAIALTALAVERAINAGGGPGIVEAVRHFRDSLPGRAVLALFDVYGQAMTAGRLYPELLLWGGLALAINCVLAVFVVLLDADYTEASVIQSQKQYERIQRMRRGGMASWSGRATKRGRLPQFPWLGGVGPIAWRQLLSAMRNSRGLLMILVILAVVACPVVVVGRGERSLGVVLGMLGWISVFLTQRITFDFRGDLDHMDALKSLPVASLAIALGELVTPVLVLTLLQVLVVGATAAWMRALDPIVLLALVALVPANLILLEIDNLLFLLFPSRQTTGQPTDFQFFGRTMLMMFAKLILLLIAAALAGGAGFAAYYVLSRSLIAAIGAGLLVLSAIGAALVPCVAWAFRRFDLSTETPP